MFDKCNKMGEHDEESGIPLQTAADQYYRSIFDKADKDNDGYITMHELDEMISNDEFIENDIHPNDIIRIHKNADANSDGRLDFHEFVTMMKDPELQHVFGHYMNRWVGLVVPRALRRSRTDDVDGVYEDQYTCYPPSLGMIIISITEAIFFIIDEYNDKNSTPFASGPMARLFIFKPKLRLELWRFITYMFVHIGYLHLVVNLIFQLFLGIPLEMVHGWFRILTVYASGVIAGSLATSVTDPRTMLAGASGGVYSLITAHFATIIMNWKEMTCPLVHLFIFLLVTGVDVGTAIYDRYNGKLDQHIGYVAHFAGALAGILVGINVLRNLKVTKKERVLSWIALVIYVVLMASLILFNIFAKNYFT